MLRQGLLNKQIAFDLGVGETTVKAHVSEILRKLKVASRTQAVIEAAKIDFEFDPRRPARRLAGAPRCAAAGEEVQHQRPQLRRLHRFQKYLATHFACRLGDRRAAIGGDDDGRYRRAEGDAQRVHGIETVAPVVEVVVGEDEIGPEAVGAAARDEAGEIARAANLAVPAFEQPLHRIEHGRVVVDDGDLDATVSAETLKLSAVGAVAVACRSAAVGPTVR